MTKSKSQEQSAKSASAAATPDVVVVGPAQVTPSTPPPPYQAKQSSSKVEHVSQKKTVVTAQAPQQTVVMVQPGNNMMYYGKISSFRTTCPFCKAEIMTRCIEKFSTMDIIMCLIFLFVFFPLIIIVFACSPWHDFQHSCPNCNQILGVCSYN